MPEPDYQTLRQRYNHLVKLFNKVKKNETRQRKTIQKLEKEIEKMRARRRRMLPHITKALSSLDRLSETLR